MISARSHVKLVEVKRKALEDYEVKAYDACILLVKEHGDIIPLVRLVKGHRELTKRAKEDIEALEETRFKPHIVHNFCRLLKQRNL